MQQFQNSSRRSWNSTVGLGDEICLSVVVLYGHPTQVRNKSLIQMFVPGLRGGEEHTCPTRVWQRSENISQ